MCFGVVPKRLSTMELVRVFMASLFVFGLGDTLKEKLKAPITQAIVFFPLFL